MRSVCLGRWLRLALLLTLLSGRATAQSTEIARLRQAVGNMARRNGFAPDTAYVDTLNLLSHAFYGINADSAFFYCQQALENALRIGYTRGESVSWRMRGNTYELIGDYANMLSSYQHSLDIAERIGDARLIAKANVNFALFYRQVGEYDSAERIMNKVAEIYQKNGDSTSEYIAAHQADQALREGHYDQALQYGQQELGIVTAAKDPTGIANAHNDIGRILVARGSYSEALNHYQQAHTYFRQVDDRLDMTSSATLVAQAYCLMKDYPRALQYAREAFGLAQTLGRKKEIGESAKVLADIYEAKEDDHNAFHYFKLYKDYSDSLANDQTHKQLFALAQKYDFQKREAQLRTQEAEKEVRQQQALRKASLLVFIAVLVAIILCIVAFFLFRSRAVSRRTNRLLQAKNEKIEEQKEAMEHQAVQLLLNNQQKDKLFSIVAHDLRGPLDSLKGILDFLKEKKLPEQEIHSMLAELRRNVDNSSELVGNLLFWASSQLNGINVTPVHLSLQSLIASILALFTQQAREKQVILQNQAQGPLVGFADKDMIQIVIRNMVSNAIKFCRPGDSITICATRKNGEIEIKVVDTGIGIKEDVLEKILRSESVTSYGTAREKGTGLGLLLCREFAESNGGQFRIESQWGKGCTCYFTIPAAPSSSSIKL